MKITLVGEEPIFKAIFENGKHIGNFVRDVDGFMYFEFLEGGELWGQEHLQMIVDKLKELNKDWQDNINKYFENHG